MRAASFSIAATRAATAPGENPTPRTAQSRTSNVFGMAWQPFQLMCHPVPERLVPAVVVIIDEHAPTGKVGEHFAGHPGGHVKLIHFGRVEIPPVRHKAVFQLDGPRRIPLIPPAPFRGKDLLSKVPQSRRYSLPQQAVPTIAALVIIREKLLRPILAGIRTR
jgi:hypothetical protein